MNRLEELLLLWQDQSISADQLAELKRLLATPAGRAQAAQDFFLTGVVLESLRVQGAAGEIAASAENLPAPAAASLAPRFLWLAGLAAALLVAVDAFIWRPAPPEAVPVFAQFEQVQGETFVVSQEQRRPALAGQILVPGQGIATQGEGSEAVVQMEDAVRLKLGGDTVVFTTTERDKVDADGTRVVLEQGELFVQATRSLKRKKMTVETPLGVAISESEETSLHVSDTLGVVVVRGEVSFLHKATGKSITLQAGQYVVATPGGDLYAAQFFAGQGRVWTTFPTSGLGTNALGYWLAFAPDGQTLAAANRTGEGGVLLGPVEGPQSPISLRGQRGVAFTPDSQNLATADQMSLLLWNLTNQESRTLKDAESRAPVAGLALSPDGKTLAVARGVNYRDASGQLELWDVPTGQRRAVSRGHAGIVTCLAFSPDGRLLATASLDKSVMVWDTATAEERTRILMVPAQIAWSLAFAPDGQTLAIGTGAGDFRLRQPAEVKLWDVARETVRTTLHGHDRAVTGLCYAADGQTLISAGADATVRFWDTAAGREYGMLKGHQASPGFEALAVAISPDGNWLATASFDRTVKLWKTTWTRDAAGSRISAQAHSPYTRSLAFLTPRLLRDH